jgi:hypothetical protein
MIISTELIHARKVADVAYREYRAAASPGQKYTACNQWLVAQQRVSDLVSAGHRDYYCPPMFDAV